jgi:hypothetical protein
MITRTLIVMFYMNPAVAMQPLNVPGFETAGACNSAGQTVTAAATKLYANTVWSSAVCLPSRSQ